ncbi:unnamed protein product, partial [Rotaria magnacalcarata]
MVQSNHSKFIFAIVPNFMVIVAALNNCFHVPMVVASPEDDDIVR